MLARDAAPERSFRGPGCDERCHVVQALVPGVFGRSDLLLHDADAHEAYGRGLRPSLVVTGRLRVDTDSLTVSVARRSIGLSPTELKVLVLLARHLGEVVDYETLLTVCWGQECLRVPRPVRLHMQRATLSRLRRRLRPEGDLIVAVYGVGLRLDSLPEGSRARRPALVHPRTLGPAWATDWDRCQRCRSTRLPHNGRGLCTGCWKAKAEEGSPHD